MEHVGAISEGEWNSLNGMCSDEAEFMAQLLGNCSLPDEALGDSNFPAFWPAAHALNANISVADHGTNGSAMYCFSQGSSVFSPFSSSHESYYPGVAHQVFVNKNNSNLCMMEGEENNYKFLNQDVSNDSVESNENMPEDDVLHGKNLLLETELVIPMPKPPREDKVTSPSECKKRSRMPGDRNKRSMKLEKCMNTDDNDVDKNNNNLTVLHRQSSSSCCSEDDSNIASHVLNGAASCLGSKGSGALNLNGKTRANRGSATDPQSLYARKRRERINERLRILQNLVPNGTKVDISTMLEEAVQYVKFLQLQIKLLSSDELWMYAPIAYNGMDIGLGL